MMLSTVRLKLSDILCGHPLSGETIQEGDKFPVYARSIYARISHVSVPLMIAKLSELTGFNINVAKCKYLPQRASTHRRRDTTLAKCASHRLRLW